LSIAWAVMEYLSSNLKAKTLFATHYHELTELEGMLDGVKNYRISVKETSAGIIFLRKIVRGGTNKSFGIEVAALAGLPKPVIKRSKEILRQLEEADINNTRSKSAQFSFLEEEKPQSKERGDVSNLLAEVSATEVNDMTPLQALNYLTDLVDRVKNML
jgi:DNA mismatch repair protein mutS